MITEALRSQGRVITALMLREARTRYGRQKFGYAWALIEPILYISFFSYFFSLIGRANPFNGSVAIFLTTGFANFHGFRDVMNRTKGGFSSNEALLSFPVVKVTDVYLARGLLEFATWTLVVIILLGTLIAAGQGSLPSSIPLMATAMLALFAIAFGVGMTLGVVALFFPALSSLMAVPNRVLFVTSGLFFVPDALPPVARDVVSWNPVLHGITLFRIGYYHLYDSKFLSLNYLFGWAVGAILVGLAAERLSRKAALAMY